MTNGEKFIDVFGVACGIYDEKNKETIIQLKGDWWDKEYEGEETNFKDIRDDFASDVYGTLSFLPTNSDANRIIDSFDRATSELEDELAKAEDFKKKAGVVIEQLRADRDRLATALDEIMVEIEQEYKVESEHPYGQGLRRALEIIDKHKGEEGGKDEMSEV